MARLTNAIPFIAVSIIIADLAIAVYAAYEGPFPAVVPLGSPLAYRNIYIHPPVAFTTYIIFGLAGLASALYLWRRDVRFSRLALYAAGLGVIYGFTTLATGIAWASESWGAPWSWDPKQTAVLLMLLAYLGYFPLRSSIGDPERRELVSSVYLVASLSLVILSILANRVLESLHPTGEAVRDFASDFQAGWMFGARMILAIGTGLSMIVLSYMKTGLPRPLLTLVAIAALLSLASAVYMAAPLLEGEYYRVVNAEVGSNGLVYSITVVKSDGSEETIRFSTPVESPVKPATTTDGRPTLTGHIIVLSGDGSLRVLPHWSTPLSLALYTIAVLAGVEIARRSSKGG
ncbi:heme exporter protein C [Aeropyrum pernix K1]|uniref:Heme exporter protein C n=1 Tax=Aeropyrum pernix (strain ATCC 700893 / DSM 11879 / JCM 9820 / NBRC 100138 / K1) TaxID=272557 RepID=Q9YG29_AERPE|nr:cytochrome c biogenesis protein CcsA [Aeropyrum pernix]BAA78981.1 heme exporter protein C [Aeropyrum pernix K1]